MMMMIMNYVWNGYDAGSEIANVSAIIYYYYLFIYLFLCLFIR